MKKTDIVFCAVTNSVLYAGDALFDADGKAYRVECAPEGATVGAFDADLPEVAPEPDPELTALAKAARDADADHVDAAAEPDSDDEPAGEDYPSARHNGRRHGNRGR